MGPRMCVVSKLVPCRASLEDATDTHWAGGEVPWAATVQQHRRMLAKSKGKDHAVGDKPLRQTYEANIAQPVAAGHPGPMELLRTCTRGLSEGFWLEQATCRGFWDMPIKNGEGMHTFERGERAGEKHAEPCSTWTRVDICSWGR